MDSPAPSGTGLKGRDLLTPPTSLTRMDGLGSASASAKSWANRKGKDSGSGADEAQPGKQNTVEVVARI